MDPNTLLFPLAKRFVAGITKDDALAALNVLNAQGLSATLDFLGEDVFTDAEADATKNAYLAMITALKSTPRTTNLSLKLSAFGILFDRDKALGRVREICEAAKKLPDSFVRIDMERAESVSNTLAVTRELSAAGYETGPVLQAYLKRTPDDVRAMIEAGLRVRLCKGAYSEPADISHTEKSVIRREFLRSAEELLRNGKYPGIATHDPGIIDAVRRFVREQQIDSKSFEFQMLYGVRPALQRELAAAGYNVRVYVPYGTHWMGYFKRRIMERRENAIFAVSAMFTR